MSTGWQKIKDVVEIPESTRAKPSPYLEVRMGERKISFRVNFRQGDIDLREVIEGDFTSVEDWKEANRKVDNLISRAKFGEKPAAPSLIRSEELCDEVVGLKKSKSEATFQQAEIFFRVHIKPFLNGKCAYDDQGKKPCLFRSYVDTGQCAYAENLNPSTWLNYKAHIRLHRPEVALFNHWKFFVNLFRHAYDKGVLKTRHKLEFDEEREDSREEGLIIPDADLENILRVANRVWRERTLIGRFTPTRPGEIRRARKEFLDFNTGIMSYPKWFTKTRSAREYLIESEEILEIYERRARLDSPFFFPSEYNHEKHMGGSLTGWHSALRTAGVDPNYTPHDLRHTYLTERFKESANPALECFAAGLSIEEAQKTYLHFTAHDTRGIAHAAAERTVKFQEILRGKKGAV